MFILIFDIFSFPEQSSRGLILSPSRELAAQIHGQLTEVSGSCGRVVRSVDLSSGSGAAVGCAAELPTGEGHRLQSCNNPVIVPYRT